MNITTSPKIRNHEQFMDEIAGRTVISDEVLDRWDQMGHSVSGHFRTMYSICKGISAKKILEIGFGRTSLMFSRIAVEHNGEFLSCDTRDFTFVFSEEEKKNTRFFAGNSDELFKSEHLREADLDFIFLDYFSGEFISEDFCLIQIRKALKYLKRGGFLCIHDVCDDRYPIHKIPDHLKLIDSLEVLILPYQQGLCVIRKLQSTPSLLVLIYHSFDHMIRSILLILRKVRRKFLKHR